MTSEKTNSLATNITEAGRDAATGIIAAGQEAATAFIKERLNRMTAVVEASEKAVRSGENNFSGINEEAILSFVHDKRSIAGVGPLLLGIFLAATLPNGWGLLSIPFFAAFLLIAFFGYVWPSRVDISEGYEGVVCVKGAPDKNAASKTGRNWELDFLRFIPYKVATKTDQIARISVANFTRDFASVNITMQIVFRVTDRGRFVSETSPALAMRLMQIYARYIALRMITSIDDARVKFIGRDNLENVAAELNRYLRDYGITVLRVTMPEAENGILDDLEEIRIGVNETAILSGSKPMRLEAAVKAIETEMRRNRKNALALAQELQNEGINFESAVSVAINSTRQQLVIDAQRQVTTKHAELEGLISGLQARITKAEAIKTSIPSLKRSYALRLAQIKQQAAMRMLPKQVVVFDVPGIGTGIGLRMGTDVLKSVMNTTDPIETATVETSETQAG